MQNYWGIGNSGIMWYSVWYLLRVQSGAMTGVGERMPDEIWLSVRERMTFSDTYACGSAPINSDVNLRRDYLDIAGRKIAHKIANAV